MPNTLPHFPFWAKDWLASSGTRRLSLAARGAYIDLLCFQWEDGSIPAMRTQCERICGCNANEMQTVWDELLPHFPICADDPTKRANPRLEAERNRAIVKVQSNRKSAEARWSKTPHANAMRTQCEGNAIQSQSQSHKNTHTAREAVSSEEGGPDPRQVTTAVDQWHRYLREKWEEFPDSADVKYDAETLRGFCREHAGTKPADHVAYSIQRKAKTLQPKYPRLSGPAQNGKAGRSGLNVTDTRAMLRAKFNLPDDSEGGLTE
jgi:uncharacterized protein YdaU (DUF1376 family)